MIINCLFCEKEFEVPNKKTKYCSRKCKESKIKKICLRCNSFYWAPEYKRYSSNYCSHRCNVVSNGIMRKKELIDRFVSKVASKNDNGCMNW